MRERHILVVTHVVAAHIIMALHHVLKLTQYCLVTNVEQQ